MAHKLQPSAREILTCAGNETYTAHPPPGLRAEVFQFPALWVVDSAVFCDPRQSKRTQIAETAQPKASNPEPVGENTIESLEQGWGALKRILSHALGLHH